MRKLEVENADVMRLAIHDEIQRSDESRYDHRLHGLLLVSRGYSARQVADLLDQSARTVQYWVRRFNEDGFAGLHEGERPGRHQLPRNPEGHGGVGRPDQEAGRTPPSGRGRADDGPDRTIRRPGIRVRNIADRQCASRG